jgi:hypothetical protein
MIGFVLGIIPFILYDIQNGPTYIKFPLWIANRVRLFIGITANHYSTQSSLPSALETIYQQISGIISPELGLFGLIFMIISILYLTYKIILYKNNYYLALLLLFVIPLMSFLLHASPGTAYFGLVYPPAAIIAAIFIDYLFKKKFLFLFGFLMLIFFNFLTLFSNEFFVKTENGPHPMPPLMYDFGPSWKISEDAAKAIVLNASGKSFSIIGKGTLSQFRTSIDPYIYLAWYNNGQVSGNASLKYLIYREKELIPRKAKIIYKQHNEYIQRYE